MAIDAQTIATLAAGIGGTLGTIKLIRFVASRRAGPGEEEGEQPKPHETVKEYKERLFPNGERDQIIVAINYLKAENIARQRERDELNATLKDIVGRLERAKL